MMNTDAIDTATPIICVDAAPDPSTAKYSILIIILYHKITMFCNRKYLTEKTFDV